MTPRSEAKSSGLTRYFTGKPCPRGHVSERMTSNGRCCICIDEDKRNRRKQRPDEHKQYMKLWHEKNAQKELEYRSENRERISERSRQWRIKNRDRHAENAKNWRLNNLERCNENRRRWRRENPERERFLAKRWRLTNPEKQRTIMFNRNCATRGLRQAIRHGAIDELMEMQSGLCVYCKYEIEKKFDVDHKTPVSRGGSNNKENLQLLCISCNRSKRDKTHGEFLEWMKLEPQK